LQEAYKIKQTNKLGVRFQTVEEVGTAEEAEEVEGTEVVEEVGTTNEVGSSF